MLEIRVYQVLRIINTTVIVLQYVCVLTCTTGTACLLVVVLLLFGRPGSSSK
jgi:hypothetical protein